MDAGVRGNGRGAHEQENVLLAGGLSFDVVVNAAGTRTAIQSRNEATSRVDSIARSSLQAED